MKKLKLLFLFISLAALGQDNDSNVWSGFDTNGFSGVFYTDDNIKFMKGFEVKLIKASKDPMVNRPFDKYVKTESYYLMNKKVLSKIKLKKKEIYKTLELSNEDISKLNTFIKSTSISLKKEQDIIKLLTYLNSI